MKLVLRLRFRAKTLDGRVRRFAEAIALTDTPENRARLEKLAAVIGAEVKTGTFDYLKWFATGNRALEFRPQPVGPGTLTGSYEGRRPWTVGSYYVAWIKRKVAPMVRPSQARDYRNHFRDYILLDTGAGWRSVTARNLDGDEVEQKGFEPSTGYGSP